MEVEIISRFPLPSEMSMLCFCMSKSPPITEWTMIIVSRSLYFNPANPTHDGAGWFPTCRVGKMIFLDFRVHVQLLSGLSSGPTPITQGAFTSTSDISYASSTKRIRLRSDFGSGQRLLTMRMDPCCPRRTKRKTHSGWLVKSLSSQVRESHSHFSRTVC